MEDLIKLYQAQIEALQNEIIRQKELVAEATKLLSDILNEAKDELRGRTH